MPVCRVMEMNFTHQAQTELQRMAHLTSNARDDSINEYALALFSGITGSVQRNNTSSYKRNQHSNARECAFTTNKRDIKA